jgi:glycosyltransferase involved in cell wall biosynthesis
MAKGLHIAVDGSGLARPGAGVGVYTREVLLAMTAARTPARFTVYLPAGARAPFEHPSVSYRQLPAMRLVGRHWTWPRRVSRLGLQVYFGPAGQLPLGNLAVPSVITVHDLAIYRHPEWFPDGQWLSTRLVVPRSIRRADTVLAVSEQTRRDIAEIFGRTERVDVVHHGVAARFKPLPAPERAALRARLGLPERFILFVSTIEPRKNLETLLDAWAQLAHRPPLVVVGGWGWRFERIKAAIERAGDGVILLDAVDPTQLPGLYSLATCLAHPAWYEGFGLTPLEAMACGTPVISSDASSLPEVVGDAAILVDPGDVEGWRRALERLLGEPELASDLRRRGLLRAAEFSWDRPADRTLAAIARAATE